jgi:hypothetical protein
LTHPHDAIGTTDAREECVQRVAPPDLEALGAKHPKPLSVVDYLAWRCPAAQHLDRDLLNASTSQLLVKALDPQLWPAVRELVYLAQQPLKHGVLDLKLTDDSSMELKASLECC